VLEETAALHAGDEDNRALWNEFLPWCREDNERIYQRLAITFDHQLGESFYHDQLGSVVEELKRKGLARESEGAQCVFLDGFDTPMIVQKKDGAFLYSTTDLATIRYRMQVWKPDAVLYVVDHRQHEHFDKLFAAARKWGFDRVQLVHVSFGTVLGDDGKPFKTRSGGTVGLEGLLDEAEEKARGVLREMNSPHLAGMDAAGLERIATTVGIGALKYADLSQNRASDYKFSYDKMLELKGNTATYLQYLYARVQGVFREGEVDEASLRRTAPEFDLSTAVERQLAIQLVRFAEVLDDVALDYRPNLLAQYLFELAQQFFRFYDQCPVLKAEPESLRQSRLALCDLTARTVRQGLQLLGIGVVDRM
jgi:arginyl-tRNA synthetase